MKRCPRCDSDNTVRVLSAKAIMVLPELRQEVKAGRAVVCTSCTGPGSSKTFKCNDCKLQWDELMEDAIRQGRTQEEANESVK